YAVQEGDARLGIVFRDHALSDLIGFHYQRSDPGAAADSFVANLHGIGQAIQSEEQALVSVILDGENCWEHYPGGGVAFLRELYGRCTLTPGVQPTTVGDYLERFPPQDTLPHLFAGSWISHNFAIWIGHEEDNTAWDTLHRTREYLCQRERDAVKMAEGKGAAAEKQGVDTALALTRIRQAWEEIYIAEGSD